MKRFPRHPGVLLVEDSGDRTQGCDLGAEQALELVKAASIRQRTLGLEQLENSAQAANEVIALIDELKPSYRSAHVSRGERSLVVLTPRR